MKTLAGFLILCTLLVLSSCEEDDPGLGENYVKANINGFKSVYKGLYNHPFNAVDDFGLYITFENPQDRDLFWVIAVMGIDLRFATLPLTIEGPRGSNPIFYCNIIDTDPKHSAYGRMLFGSSSEFNNSSITILSLEDGLVKGVFEGKGIDVHGSPASFANGEFSARVKVW